MTREDFGDELFIAGFIVGAILLVVFVSFCMLRRAYMERQVDLIEKFDNKERDAYELKSQTQSQSVLNNRRASEVL